MLKSQRNEATVDIVLSDQLVVDRLPSSFVNDQTTFRGLLGEQIDRFWPASGLNFLFDDEGNVNGFFDGSYLYMFHLSEDCATYTVATCIKDCATNDERYEGIKQILLEKAEDFTVVESFSLEWTDHKELVLKQELVPVDLVQECQVDGFESSIDEFINTAHRITGLIKKSEKMKKRESKKGSIFRKRASKITQEKQKEAIDNKQKIGKTRSKRSIRNLFTGGDWSGKTELDDSDNRLFGGSGSHRFNGSDLARLVED
mmetsp:Transcript_2208/g.3483  ORF Transcript_2208/g.3483 Transcript_2208/m.3483 type:complete len:258 (-) Transcript_2208:135-908(-)|eukprot:CAMPEP_0119013082 /NCGR_PEP_ID=MMETSP1176-20130426/7890_1 /TAXON_ID=265551 /ORGANISM="Synedropsis recta cf, Strain CCMP1620" /LENGTH=257 /DNA_ID=CAMNT_0006966133 /DNA_START=112 /DNA_END=885 /DNA_ORIENTATION=-